MIKNNTYKPNSKKELDIEIGKYFEWWRTLSSKIKTEIMMEMGVKKENLINHSRFFSELDFLDKKRIFQYYSEYKINEAEKKLKGVE